MQRVVGLGAPAQRLGEGRRADRHDHELLEVDVVVGVHAAVEHVHHRHRQHVGVGAADVAVQRQLELVGRGLGHGERHAEDGVGAEAGLVVGAVEVDQRPVDAALVERVEADDGVGDLAVDVGDGVEHALAAEAVAAVAQLDRLERPGRGAGRDDRPAHARRESSTTSTSTVGLPRESRTSRPTMCSMVLTALVDSCCGCGTLLHELPLVLAVGLDVSRRRAGCCGRGAAVG